MRICTIIAKNYVAQARVLAETFREAHPEGTCSVLFIDRIDGYIDPDAEPFEVILPEQLNLPDFERMSSSYEITELSTAVKPWLLRHLLDRHPDDPITYLDPDIQVFADLTEIDDLARRHGLVLNPHFTAPLPRDPHKPSETDILLAGTYNLGFISLRASSETDRLLDWWSERLVDDCRIDPSRGYFVDQRWIDLVPGFVQDMHVLRDPGYNVAYWNLPARKLDKGDDGYIVDDRPLRFFHFSGFDPRRPNDLSKHQDRIDISAEPVLAELCSGYRAACEQRGFEAAAEWPYDWDFLADGTPLDRTTRRLYLEAADAGRLNDSIFTARGTEQLLAYLNERLSDVNGSHLTRYLHAMWRGRPDLVAAFPDPDGKDAARFGEWVKMHANLPLSFRSMPEASDTESASGAGGSASANGKSSDAPSGPSSPAGGVPWGVNVVGYLNAELGVGEAARQAISALDATGMPVMPIGIPVASSRMDHAYDLADVPEEGPFAVNLFCVNADSVPAVAEQVGERFFSGRHSVGLWFWEVSDFPEAWHKSFARLDEVWVASRHIAETLAPISPIPIVPIRLPVTPTPPAAVSRAELGMPDDFCFLFAFDYNSVFNRKNPIDLIDAFSSAFSPGDGASLVLKSINGPRHPEALQRVRDHAESLAHVHLIDEYVTAEQKSAMIASCDCYVSLHRSEGFGLTLAEAMYFHKPTIATGYSGNLDFMNASNSYLVDFQLQPIGEGSAPYPPEGTWAQPDLDHAGSLMREVFEDRERSTERGERAAAEIRRERSPAAAGALLRERIAAIQASRPELGDPNPKAASRQLPAVATDSPSARTRVRQLLALSTPPPQPRWGGFRRAAKRAYMRLLRPYAAFQHNVDESLLAALDELGAGAEQRREQDLAEAERDRQVQRAELLASLRLRDSRTGQVREDVAAVQRSIGELSSRIEGLAGLLSDAHAIPFMARGGPFESFEHPHAGTVMGFLDQSSATGRGYRGFEDIFRGSEEMIAERQRVYVPIVAPHPPVLDAGCGRGEFLDLLRDAGVAYSGVDRDPGMVARCREKDHGQVVESDINQHLEGLEDGSLGCLFAAQVVEHLSSEDLERFLELAARKLRRGGLLVAETVNPHSARALKTFWVDPTHQHPLFPEVMLTLGLLAGFSSAFVFHPNGTGDFESDRTQQGEYALVAAAPGK